MAWLDAPPLDSVVRRTETELSDRYVRAAVGRGTATRIAPGASVATDAWRALSASDRHAQRVWEAATRLSPGTVISHFAAAALHGMQVLGPLPSHVEVTTEHPSGSSGRIRRHHRRLSHDDVMAWGDHFVTRPSRTAVDVAAATATDRRRRLRP